MTEELWRPLRPNDWVNLERIINEIWLILNTNITLSEINQGALDAAADIAALQAAITVLQAAVASLDSIAGSDKQIQFNDGGVHGADSTLTFDKTTKTLSTSNIVVGRILAGGVSE